MSKTPYEAEHEDFDPSDIEVGFKNPQFIIGDDDGDLIVNPNSTKIVENNAPYHIPEDLKNNPYANGKYSQELKEKIEKQMALDKERQDFADEYNQKVDGAPNPSSQRNPPPLPSSASPNQEKINKMSRLGLAMSAGFGLGAASKLSSVEVINNLMKNPQVTYGMGPREPLKRASVSVLGKGGMMLKPLVQWPLVGFAVAKGVPLVAGGALSIGLGAPFVASVATVAVFTGPIFAIAGTGIAVVGALKALSILKTKRSVLSEKIARKENSRIMKGQAKSKRGLSFTDKAITVGAGVAVYSLSKAMRLTLDGLRGITKIGAKATAAGVVVTAKSVSDGFISLAERQRLKNAKKQAAQPVVFNPKAPKP